MFDVISDAYGTFFNKLPSNGYTFEEIESEIPFDQETQITIDKSPEMRKARGNSFDNGKEINLLLEEGKQR